jgi:hypothetical protein
MRQVMVEHFPEVLQIPFLYTFPGHFRGTGW